MYLGISIWVSMECILVFLYGPPWSAFGCICMASLHSICVYLYGLHAVCLSISIWASLQYIWVYVYGTSCSVFGYIYMGLSAMCLCVSVRAFMQCIWISVWASVQYIWVYLCGLPEYIWVYLYGLPAVYLDISVWPPCSIFGCIYMSPCAVYLGVSVWASMQCIWVYLYGPACSVWGVYLAFNTPITSSVFRYPDRKLRFFAFALKIPPKHLFVGQKASGLSLDPIPVPISFALPLSFLICGSCYPWTIHGH